MKKTVAVVLLSILGGMPLFAQGKFSGYMFGEYYYNLVRDPATPSTTSSGGNASVSSASGSTAMQAFQFRRIYFTFDNDISEKFMSRFRLEVDQSALTSNSKIGSYVKDAFLRWKGIFGTSDLFFGIQPPPTYEVSEAAWGYRSLEKTIMDLRGIVASRDFGVALKGKLTNDGMFNYWVMVGNGAGTGSVENDKYKRYYIHVQAKPTSEIQATLNFDYADRADVSDPYHPGTKVGNGMTTISGFVGYAEGKINAGAEAFMQSTVNGYNDGTALASKNGIGLSLFGSYNLQPDMAVIGRYDYYDPNTAANGAAYGDIRNYVLVGFSWKPDKNVSVIPNILYETYENAAITNQSYEPSITVRVTLYYVFI